MPAAENSHAESSSPRPRVTDTHGPYSVGEFRVLRVGGIVALHLGTPSGPFIFHVRECDFVRHARATTDDQGNPFRTLRELEAERLRVEFANLPVPTAKPTTKCTGRDNRRLSRDKELLYVAAWVELKTTPGATQRSIANKHQLPQHAWSDWCYRNRGECEASLRESQAPIFQTNGGAR